MIYHRPCIFIKLEVKGELRGAPTSYLLAAVEITAAAGGEAKFVADRDELWEGGCQ
mgnify:CR=1 FL=1